MQVTWLPAIPFYTQIRLRGASGRQRPDREPTGRQYPDLLEETPGPRLFTGFVKVSPDLGFSNTLQGRVSIGRSRSHQEAATDGPPRDVYDGSAWFLGTDWIWRYDSARPYGEGDLTVQGEYIYRSKTLELVSCRGPAGAGFAAGRPVCAGRLRRRPSMDRRGTLRCDRAPQPGRSALQERPNRRRRPATRRM